jgi:hypothetical protein
MNIIKIRSHFSSARINRYLIATGNNNTRAIKLYKHNLRVSQSFLPVLSILEVAIRNGISTILTSHFTDPDWIINQKNGFMSHPSLTYTKKSTGRIAQNDFLKNCVLKSENKLTRQRLPLSSGKIISDQNLGFWTELFELTFYKILNGRSIQIFTNLPPNTNRTDVLNRLHKIRNFRNRISHSEPICFHNNNIDFSNAIDVYDTIMELFDWIDPDLRKLIKDIDSVAVKITNAQRV